MSNYWKHTPTCFEQFDGKTDYMLFIDETGVPTLKNYNQNNRWFSMTGVLIAGDEGENIISDIFNRYYREMIFINLILCRCINMISSCMNSIMCSIKCNFSSSISPTF